MANSQQLAGCLPRVAGQFAGPLRLVGDKRSGGCLCWAGCIDASSCI